MEHIDPNILHERIQNFYEKSFIPEEDCVEAKTILDELLKNEAITRKQGNNFVINAIFSKKRLFLLRWLL